MSDAHEVTDAEVPTYMGVGAIVYVKDGRPPDKGAIEIECSAIAIDRRFVLTAAHCFSAKPCGGSPPSRDRSKTKYYFVPGQSSHDGARALPVSAIVCLDRSGDCSQDVALLRLERVVDPAPVWIDTIVKAAAKDRLFKVGYGYFRPEDRAAGVDPPGVMAAAEMRVLEVGPSTYSYGPPPHGSATPRVCQGDSGGPGFVKRGGKLALAGITSTILLDTGEVCGSDPVDVMVAAHKDWILAQESRLGVDPPPSLFDCPLR